MELDKALDPDDVWFTEETGWVYIGLGQPKLAERHFRKAIKTGPDSSTARYNIAIAQAMLGRGAETLDALAVALEHDHNPGYARSVVSELLKSGLKTEAERASRMINRSGSLESA